MADERYLAKKAEQRHEDILKQLDEIRKLVKQVLEAQNGGSTALHSASGNAGSTGSRKSETAKDE